MRTPRLLAGIAIAAIVIAACGTAATPVPATLAVATAAPVVAATVAPTVAPTPVPTPAKGQVIPHQAGAAHKLQPKRLEAVFEIDMGEMYFANVQGQKNPTFTFPTGKTIGIHIHNEGTEMHEFVIGRKLNAKGDDYEETLTKLVESDVFFYYGDVKAEVGGSMYGELEMDEHLRDVWIRIKVPENLKGEWELGCFAPEHYKKGMHAKVIFQ